MEGNRLAAVRVDNNIEFHLRGPVIQAVDLSVSGHVQQFLVGPKIVAEIRPGLLHRDRR